MSTAMINTEILSWARARSGIDASAFAKKCGVTEDRLVEWETGHKAMTFIQAMKYADKAHVPFGYLFLETPPEENLPIPDLRTLNSSGVQNPSAELLDIVKLMIQRQEWYKEYLKTQLADPNSIIGKFTSNSNPAEIVSDMRNKLGLAAHPERGSWEDYYRDLVARIEKAGVLVMRQSNLGSYTRPLKVEEFRGFAIFDAYAPIIFVNHADAPGARLFTLVHELCHIWIGQSGISDGSVTADRQEEILSNAVAAELLVPAVEFETLWRDEVHDWHDKLAALESHFHVSKWVLARRALTLGFIETDDYRDYIYGEKVAHANRVRGNSTPTYYKTKKSQISQIFSKAVVSQALNSQLLLRDAGQLLGNMKPGNISKFAKELGF
jgi:Zn-dependent peptidase ImmA (M78 family)/DNA-binding XRE family transcriptional regulator